MIAGPGTLGISGAMPPGLLELVGVLGQRFGNQALRPASQAVTHQMGCLTLELVVPANQIDEVSMFSAELTVRIEDQFDEEYTVVVVPSDLTA